MHEVMRKRLMRKLEGLPEAQLYQVLDYIEFLEARYAREIAREPDAFQRMAERLEDRLRARSLAPAAIGGTMKIIGTAGRVLDSLSEVGRGLLDPRVATSPAPARTEPENATEVESAHAVRVSPAPASEGSPGA